MYKKEKCMKYMVEVWNENNKLVNFLIESADGYCAEIEIRKTYPNYEIGKVIRLTDFNEYKLSK